MKKKQLVCPICAEVNSRPKWEMYSYRDKRYSMHICQGCESEFSAPMKAASSEYYSYDTPALRWEFGKVAELLPQDAKVLDVGCSDGSFMKLLADAGIQSTGIDFNEKKVRQARGRGLDCHTANIQEAPIGDRKYNAVSAFHVIEHLERPVDFFEDIKSVLSQLGKIYISVPNTDRFSLKFRRDEPDYPPNHLTRISKKGMGKLVERTGFHIINTYIEPSEINWRRASSEASNRIVDLLKLRKLLTISQLINIPTKLVLYVISQPFVAFRFLAAGQKEGYTGLYVLERKR